VLPLGVSVRLVIG